MKYNLSLQSRSSWHSRASCAAEIIYKLLAEKNQTFSIADVGCGDQKLLRSLKRLALKPLYYPFDICPQSSGVVLFDISKQKLNSYFDFVALLGVAEYLCNLQNVLGEIYSCCSYLVISLVVTDASSYTDHDLIGLGWKNYMSSRQAEKLFVSANFRICNRIVCDSKTYIWLLTKN